VPALPAILEGLDHPQAAAALERLRGGHRLGKAYMDRTKLTDHHAILPTGKPPSPSLSPQLSKIYHLVVVRFVGVFLPDQVVEETAVTIDIGGAALEKGRALIGLVAEPLRRPELTAEWEQELKEVEGGRRPAGEFYRSYRRVHPGLGAPSIRRSSAVARAGRRGTGASDRAQRTGRETWQGAARELGRLPTVQGRGVYPTVFRHELLRVCHPATGSEAVA